MRISPSSTLPDARLVPRVLNRRVVFIGLLLLPLLFVVGSVLQPSGAIYFLPAALILATPLAIAIVYEQTYRLWLSDDGVEVRRLTLTGMKQQVMRFDDIERIYVVTRDPSQGGDNLVEAGAALLDKITRREGNKYNEHTQDITVTLHGAGTKLKLTNGNKGIEGVWRVVVDNTKARLQAAALDALEKGGNVEFGPYTLAPSGVQWRNTLVAWSDIATFDVDENDKLVLKKSGAWLATSNPKAQKVPNLDVLLAVVNEKRSEV